MFRLLVVHKVHEIGQQLWTDMELLSHDFKHGMQCAALETAEFHETQEQHRLLAGSYLTVQVVTNRGHDSLGVEFFGHLVGRPHIAVEVKIQVDVADAEVVTQVIHKHVLCPCLIHLFLFAEQGKQAQETGKNDVRHRAVVIL